MSAMALVSLIYATLALLRCYMLSDRIKRLASRVTRLEHPTCERTDDMGDC